jgi:hemin uptake protein HemP
LITIHGSWTEGRDQAQIVLGNQVYTLRITRAGKLILTK